MHAIRTESAPAPVDGAPYSQAIVAAGTVYVSGQVPLDPVSGRLVSGGVAEQTRQVLLNVRAVLRAAGADLDRVVRTTVYMTDLAAFGEMNAVYAELFAGHAPARATIGVAALPAGASVEIDAIAVVSG